MIKQLSSWLVVAGVGLGAEFAWAQGTTPAPNPPAPSRVADAADSPPAPLSTAQGMVMLDYQVIPVPAGKSIDLMGFHFLHQVNDWMHLGVGGYAPLVKGEYGGFMAFDVTAHAQRKVFGQLFVDAGVAAGGGGGGKSVQQSKVLSGTGGFYKAYLGLGYDMKDYTFGANLSKIKFTNSAINHAQLNLFVQVPFSYTIGPYASAGEGLRRMPASGSQADTAEPGETLLSAGLDNFSQISPEGSNKGQINLADLQLSRFITRDSYWFFNVGVGFHGLPLYNQVLGGLGHRVRWSPRVSLYGQLGVGSGGYAPDTINTGPGLIVYPKLSAEYLIDKNLGVSVSAGYLFAPKGSSKNYTFGAALNYHIFSGDLGSGAGASSQGSYRGYRFNLFQQTETDVSFKGLARGSIKLLTLQADSLIDESIYLPIQVAVAYNAYLGYPGYGELLAGVGLQSKYDKGSRFQVFGQVLVGTNVHGPVIKYGVGMNVALTEQLALYALAGQTLALDKDKFRSNYLGLGVSYRFSVPGW